MGKKRIVTTKDKVDSKGAAAPKASSKKKVESGILCVQSTYNNTMVLLTDKSGNALMASSAGALGFKGAKKGTPFAAQIAAEKASKEAIVQGVKKAEVLVCGPGAGRETAIRALQAAGLEITLIRDITPVPHNGCRPPKKRRI
jgi:small subunit ribosomal protein S11